MTKNTGSRLYDIAAVYRIVYQGFRMIGTMPKLNQEPAISRKFSERLMLAVTEVNRCAVCSYAHTRMALESGMNSAEIAGILNCQWDDVPADELKGLLFAQHYAESRGQPSAGSWAMVNENYGVDKALKILAVIRIIMIGNVYGIAYGSFIKRFKGHPDPRSTLFYELTVMILGVLILPIAAVQALLANLFRIPWIKIQI